jgi:glutathione reductase (NADPH)
VEEKYDVIVIGTGTAGETAADALRAAGKRVAVVEQGLVGGTCALRGCQPKKVLVVNAHLVAETRALIGSGIAQAAITDWGELQRFKRTFTDPIPEGVAGSLNKSGAELFLDRATFLEPGALKLNESGTTLRAEAVLIAAGARPRALSIPGAELAASSDDFLDLTELPQSMVFIGGGYISLEFAFIAALCGARVTVLQRGDRMLPQFHPSLLEPVLESGARHGITFVTDVTVSAIERSGARFTVTTDKGDHETDWVMGAIGRAPDIEDLHLERAGVPASARGIKVDEHMQAAPGIFAAGDCVDTRQLSPVSELEGRVAAANIITPRSARADYQAIPSVVFTYPQMASVGLTPAEATAAGLEINVKEGRADTWATNRRVGSPEAYYLTVTDAKSGKLLGAHIAGPAAGEMINVLALAIRSGLTAGELRRMPWAYPTYTSDLKYMV